MGSSFPVSGVKASILVANIAYFFFAVVRCNSLSGIENNDCIKPVNETVFPNCRVLFRAEGYYYGITNATCLEDNVFLIGHNRSRRSTKSDDPLKTDGSDMYMYFSAIIDEGLPPYAVISCTSLYPTDFDFQGQGALDFFRVWKTQRRNSHNITFTTITAEVLLMPEATGKYVFFSVDDPNIQTSVFIFSERGSKPFLVSGISRTVEPKKLNETATLIPCVASDMAANVTLFERVNEMTWRQFGNSEYPPYDRQKGFIVNSIVPGEYRCFSDVENLGTADHLTVHVKSRAEEQAVPKRLNIQILINNGSAICQSTEARMDIKFANVYAWNPTEARILKLCLQRRYQYCGIHSYREIREGIRITNRTCPENRNCLTIGDLHPAGVLYCEIGTNGDWVSQEYFTGMDKKIYTDVSAAPMDALLKVKWNVNSSALKTQTTYNFRCEAVSYVFLDETVNLSAKYKNGTIDKLVAGPKSRRDGLPWGYYLTVDMVEIICSNYLWKTNKLITAGTKITVTEKQCEGGQFKCTSGQCIRDAWRCDGDRECGDGSDEENCLEHHCKVGHFKCSNGLCITMDRKCNNKDECQDGSDETPQTCANTTCTSEDFKCSAGQCVPSHFLCDGDRDCLDNSDETIDHCAKFYPHFTQNKTSVTFTLNSLNELLCKVSELPVRLKPTLEWRRKGLNISDPERLWQDKTGLKLSLRFENVSESDSGEYTCVAVNKLQRVFQVFTVAVKLQESSTTTVQEKGTTTTSTTGRSAEIEINVVPPVGEIPTTKVPRIIQKAIAKEHSSSSSGVAVTIGACLLVLIIIGAVLGMVGWRYYTRRRIPVGSARMCEDHEVVFSGIN